MQKNASNSRAEAVALARFSLISRIQELLRTPVPLNVALDTVVAGSVLELAGASRAVPRRTLEDWWYAYQRGGFAALHPKARSDRGVPRVLTPEQERHILEQVKAHPAIPVKVLYRQWREADPKLPALSAVAALHLPLSLCSALQPQGGLLWLLLISPTASSQPFDRASFIAPPEISPGNAH